MLLLLFACTADPGPAACSPGALAVDSPADETWTAGAVVDVSASAEGSALQLSVDGVVMATAADHLEYQWDPAHFEDGWHELVVSASDGDGCTQDVARRVGVDRVAPEVSLDTSITGAQLEFSVNATDAQGVVETEALLDGVVVTSPVELSGGTHTLTGNGWDAAGNLGTASVEVTAAPPVVTIVSPLDGTTAAGTLTFQAEATDATGIASITLDVDGAAIATSKADTIQFEWDSCEVEVGAHTLTATAVTDDGREGSASVTITLDQPDLDVDAWSACFDCDEADPAINPDADEICADGVDQDCDGLAVGCGIAGDVYDADVIYEGSTSEVDPGVASVVADLDGDGTPEVAVPCSYESWNGEWSGAVRIAEGAASGTVDLDAAIVIEGRSASAVAGGALASGDLDGDGVADLAVAEPGMNPDPAGAVFVLTGAQALAGTDLADVPVHMDGLYSTDGAGNDLLVADMDGDGQDDLLVGAEDARTSETRADGKIFVLDGPVGEDTTLASGSSIAGTESDYGIGTDFCAGDYDGDGHHDVLAIAVRGSSTAAWLVTGPITGSITVGSQPDRLDRAAADDVSGYTVGCGDIDGDGVSDAMIGFTFDANGGSSAGAAFFVEGPLGGVRGLETSDVIVRGDEPSMYVGYDVGTGDFDLDGLGDVVVGAPRTNSSAGEVYLFGDVLGGGADIAAPTALLIGETNYGLGRALTVADVTGDDVDDILVGASSTNGAEGTGSVRVYAGGGEY